MELKASQYRVGIYNAVQAMLGRDLTPVEHDELRILLVGYVQSQTGPLMAQVGQLKEKAKQLGKSLWTIMRKKGAPETEIAFLKPLFESTESDGQTS